MELMRQVGGPFSRNLTGRARRWPIHPVGFSVLSWVRGRGVGLAGDRSGEFLEIPAGRW
jgi:hypothetical protein